MTEYIKVGSDRPDFTTTLFDTNDNPVGLEDASNVEFLMWGPNANLLISDGAEIVDTFDGEVRYDFGRDQVAAVGTNVAEVRVDWDNGDKQWFPIDRRAYEIEVTRSPGDRNANLSNVDPTQDAEVDNLTVNGTIDDPDGTVNVGGNLGVSGDLTVSGSLSINQQVLADGEAIVYGTGNDFETTYEIGPDAWLLRDLANGVALRVDRSGEVTAPNGSLTTPNGDLNAPNGGANVEYTHFEPTSEPSTPSSGCVRWYDSSDGAYKVKFDDGSIATIATK